MRPSIVDEQQLFCLIRVEQEILEEQLRERYSPLGYVGFKAKGPDDEEEPLIVELSKDRDGASIPIVQLGWEEWGAELITPNAEHFYGPGSIVYASDTCGEHEFLFERQSPKPLQFDSDEAKASFENLRSVNSRVMTNRIDWWIFGNFRLLIYRLLHLSQTDYLLQQFEDLRDLGSLSSNDLKNDLVHTIVLIYMLGSKFAEDSDFEYFKSAGRNFNLFFYERNLSLDLSPHERISELETLQTSTHDDYVTKALAIAKSLVGPQ